MRVFFCNSVIVLQTIFTFLSLAINAQVVTNYSLEVIQGVYTPIQGNELLPAQSINRLSEVTDIGFDFTIGGRSYHSFVVSTNGWIRLGTNGTDNPANPFGTGVNYIGPVISVFARQGMVNESVSYEWSGASPNRVLTIQFSDYSPNNYVTSNLFQAQIKLYESTNVIELIYGVNNITTSSFNGSVGLSPSLNSFLLLDERLDWANAKLSTNRSAVITYSSAVRPSEGLTYRFSPIACTNPTGLRLVNAQENSLTVAVTHSDTLEGTYYEWYYDTLMTTPSSNTPALLVSQTHEVVIPNLEAQTIYYIWARVVCEGNLRTSWTPFFMTYTNCPAITSLPFIENFEVIRGLTLSSCWGMGGYAHVISGNINLTPYEGRIHLELETNSTIRESKAISPGMRLHADSTYRLKFFYAADRNSNVDSLSIMMGDQQNLNGLTIKLGVIRKILPGNYREYMVDFRVPTDTVYFFGLVMNHFQSITSTLGIDLFSVHYAEPCFQPSRIDARALDTHSARVYMGTENDSWENQVYFLSSSNTPPTAEIIPSGSFLTAERKIEGLESGSTYYIWLRKECTSNEWSNWSQMSSFTTACESVSIPYRMSFDQATDDNVLSCVRSISTDLVNWNLTPQNNQLSPTFRNVNLWRSSADLFLQGVRLEQGQVYRLNYDYRKSLNNVFNMKVVLAQSINLQDTNRVILTDHSHLSGIVNSSFFVDFVVQESGVYYISFQADLPGSNTTTYTIDNVLLDFAPTCLVPSDIVVNNFTSESASLSWGQPLNGIPTQYELYYALSSNPPEQEVEDGQQVSNEQATINGLLENTTYYVWIRALCAADQKSEWSEVIQFTTDCSVTTVPYFMDFEELSPTNLPTCVTVQSNSTSSWVINRVNNNNRLRYSYYYQANESAWFYTRGVELTAGVNYMLSFKYTLLSSSRTENLQVAIGSRADSAAMQNTLFRKNNLTVTQSDVTFNRFSTENVFFQPDTSGVYYLGFKSQSQSQAGVGGVILDSILLDIAPVCYATFEVSADLISHEAATVSWEVQTHASNQLFEYVVSTSPFVSDSIYTPTGQTDLTSIRLTQLEEGVLHYFRVRGVCGPDERTEWSETFLLRTRCLPRTIPYVNSFEGAQFGLNCMLSQSNSGGPWSSFRTTSPVDNSGVTVNILSNQTSASYLFLQGLELIAGVTYRLSYDEQFTGNNLVSKIGVKYGPYPQMDQMTHSLVDPNDFQFFSGFQQQYVEFTAEQTGVFYFGFYVQGNQSSALYYLDNINIDFANGCQEPQGVTFDDLENNQVLVQWNAVEDFEGIGYDYFYSTGYALPTEHTNPSGFTGDNSIVLNNILLDSNYTVWVRSVCNQDLRSVWSVPRTHRRNYCELTVNTFNAGYFSHVKTQNAVVNLDFESNSQLAYTNNRGLTFQAYQGANIDLSVRSALFGNLYFYQWVDWNNDLILDNDTERAPATQINYLSEGLTINIPANQAPGRYLIRMVLSSNEITSICENTIRGSYTDFILEVLPIESCNVPNHPRIERLTYNIADISWETALNSLEEGYEYFLSNTQVMPSSTTVPTGQIDTTFVRLGQLDSNTVYYFWVRAICSDQTRSEWSQPIDFYTGYCVGNSSMNVYIRAIRTTGDFTNLDYYTLTRPENNYADLTRSQVLTLRAGGSGTIYFENNQSATRSAFLWVDWNQNMVFDYQELLLNFNQSINAPLTIPANTPPGRYRVRMVSFQSNSQNRSMVYNLCSTNALYSIVDFTLVVEQPCSVPTARMEGIGTICRQSTDSPVTIRFTGQGPWDYTYSFNNREMNGATSIPVVTFYPYSSGVYMMRSVRVADCIGRVSGEAIFADAIVYQNVQHNVSICRGETYILDGSRLTNPGTYQRRLTSILQGCDSFVTVVFNYKRSDEIANRHTICEGDFVQVGNSVYTQAGIYRDTFVNSVGCDSVRVSEIIVIPRYITENPQVICPGDSYTIGDSTYTQAGTYTNVFRAVTNNCDSIVRTQLMMGQDRERFNTQYDCSNRLSYESTVRLNTSTYTIPTILGCDSTITNHFYTVTFGTRINIEGYLLSVTPNAELIYEWMDCATDVVLGTSHEFEPTYDGEFKLKLSIGNCFTHTSCVSIQGLSTEYVINSQIIVYPNPTKSIVNIQSLGANVNQIDVLDINGRLIKTIHTNNTSEQVSLEECDKGVYLLNIHSNGNQVIRRVTKQ